MSMSFFKFALDKLFKQFVRSNKRFPSPAEKKQLEDLAVVEAMAARKKEQAESGIETLEDLMSKIEADMPSDPFDYSQMFKGFKPKVILGGDEAKRVKGGISTQIKLNSARENKQYAKDLIGGKSKEFKQLPDSDRKELLDLIETQIAKEGEDVFDGFAFGGLATMFRKK